MPNPYRNDPYSNQNSAYGGQQGNGYTGSQTNRSTENANAQRKPGSGAQAFGNAAQTWGSVLQQYMQPQGQPTGAQPPMGTDGMIDVSRYPQTQQGFAAPPQQQAAQFAPGQQSSAIVAGPENQTGPEGTAGGGGIPPAGPAQTGARPPLVPQTQTPVQQGVPGVAGPSTNNWGDPEWLKNAPEAAEARKDPAEAARQYALMDPRLAGITGEQVSQFRVWSQQTGSPVRIEEWFLNLGKPVYAAPPGGPGYSENRPGGGGGGAVGGLNPNLPLPPGFGDPTPAGEPTVPEPGEGGDDPTQTGMPPGVGPGPLYGDGDGTVSHTNPDDPLANPPDKSIADYLRELLGPSFEWEQQQLAKYARAEAALTGQIDSGGFGANLGSAQAQLAGEQGSRMSDYLVMASEAEKARTQEWAIAKLQDDFNRQALKTNSDLERAAQELQKYGIDKNDLLERYKADLALRGIQYSADAQIQAASLQAAAQGALAGAQLALGREKLGFEDKWQDQQYGLGILGINRDIYQSDQRDRLAWATLAWYMSPEYRQGGQPPFISGMFPY